MSKSKAKGIDDAAKAGRKLRVVNPVGDDDGDMGPPRPTLVDPDDPRPHFFCKGDLNDEMDQIKGLLKQINKGPDALYERSGDIVKITPTPNGPALKTVGVALLRGELARRICFLRTYVDKEGEETSKPAAPPEPLTKCIHGDPTEYHMPPISGIVRFPQVRRDGTVQEAPGYDSDTKTYYAPIPGLTMPKVSASPSRLEIEKAKRLIMEDVFGEFNFRTDGVDWSGKPVSASRVHAMVLACQHAMISQMSVMAIRPPFLGQAGSPGSGKSLSIRCGIVISTGQLPDEMGTCRADNEEEWTKQISRCLRSAPPAVLIDNVRGSQLDSASIDKLFTGPQFSARGMHTLDSVILDNNKIWCATSNNAVFKEDTARRFVYINLDKPLSKNEKTYRKENLLDWCLDNAGELAWAVRTIVRGWVVAGRPKWRKFRPANAVDDGAPKGGMPSYEEWSSYMGGLMDWLGLEGFLTNYREAADESNSEGHEDDKMFVAMARKFGHNQFFRPGQLQDLLTYQAEWGTDYRLPHIFANQADPAEARRSVSKQLSRWLQAHKHQERHGIRLLPDRKRGHDGYKLAISEAGRDYIEGLDPGRDRGLDGLQPEDIPV